MLPGTPARRPRRRGRVGATVTTVALVLMGVAGHGGPATGADEPGDPADGRPTIAAQEVWEGEVPRNAVSIPVTVTGTPAPTVTASGLPPGVTLFGHPAAPSSWRLTGRVTAPGEYTATLTADNGVGEPAVTTVAFRAVEPPPGPSFTGPSPDGPVTLLVGVPATIELVATGSPLPTVTVEGTLPAGLTIDGDGAGGLTITGTPTEHGMFWLTGRATDGRGTASLLIPLTVGRLPTFEADTLTLSALTDRGLDRRLAVSAYPPATTFTVTDGALPPGITFAVGRLAGVPTAAGHFEATVTARNAHGEGSMRVIIDVGTLPGFADRWGHPVDFAFLTDTPVHETIRTVGWPTPTVTTSPGMPLPPGLELRADPDDPYTWHLVGEVARGDAGVYHLELVATNSYGAAKEGLYLEVVAPVWLDPPVGGTIVAPRGEPMPPVTLRATGTISSFWVGLPYGVGLESHEFGAGYLLITLVGTVNVDGTLRWCIGGSVTNCSGGVLSTTSFVVRDRPVVVAPEAATVHVGTAAAIPPITVTTTHDATLTADGLPAGLSLVPDPGADHTWLITGRPEITAVGRHTVVLTADNGVTGTATFPLDVTGPPSSAGPASALLLVGETPTTVVRAAGLPAPAMTVTGDLPDGVTATDDGAGTLRLSGAPTRTGTWTVQVHAANEHGSTSTELTLTVEQAAAFADDTVSRTLREGHELSWAPAVAGVPAPVVSLASGGLPDGVTLTDAGALVGTPAVGSADAADGRYAVVLRVANVHGEDLLPVTLTVLSPPSFADGLSDAVIQAGTAATVTIRTGGWDRPTLTATGLPPGLEAVRVDATTWTLVGTVARADRGSYEVGLVLDNGYGAPATGTLRVGVAAGHAWSGPTAVDVGACVTSDPVDVVLTGYPIGEVTVAADPAAPTIDLVGSTPTLVRYRVGVPPETTVPASVTFTSDTGASHTVAFRSRCANPPVASPSPAASPAPTATPASDGPAGSGDAGPGGVVAAPPDEAPGDADTADSGRPAGGTPPLMLLVLLGALALVASAAALIVRRRRA